VSFLDGPAPLAFAHRGFAPDGAENSMAAFQRAMDLGYRYLETDVRVTADGVPLAFHDARLDRVTDRRGRLDRLPWALVQHARIRGREPIPRLADVLGAWPDARINIDVKCRAAIAPTVAAIRSADSVDRVCVGAFSTARVAAVRRALGPQVCTSLGPRAVLSLRVAQWARDRPLTCVQAPARLAGRVFVDARFVANAHRFGLPVHVYTVNDRAEMHRLLDLGVDGVMSDRADVLREVLTARGQWSAS
jgi:glycerophosphoryl diester phosphodiesterase